MVSVSPGVTVSNEVSGQDPPVVLRMVEAALSRFWRAPSGYQFFGRGGSDMSEL